MWAKGSALDFHGEGPYDECDARSRSRGPGRPRHGRDGMSVDMRLQWAGPGMEAITREQTCACHEHQEYQSWTCSETQKLCLKFVPT